MRTDERLTTSEARIAFLDAWTEWDDACHKRAVTKGMRSSSLTLKRETDRHIDTQKVIAEQLDLSPRVVQLLLASLLQCGFDREAALQAVEAIAIDRRAS